MASDFKVAWQYSQREQLLRIKLNALIWLGVSPPSNSDFIYGLFTQTVIFSVGCDSRIQHPTKNRILPISCAVSDAVVASNTENHVHVNRRLLGQGSIRWNRARILDAGNGTSGHWFRRRRHRRRLSWGRCYENYFWRFRRQNSWNSMWLFLCKSRNILSQNAHFSAYCWVKIYLNHHIVDFYNTNTCVVIVSVMLTI
jgi:hypothetical protein